MKHRLCADDDARTPLPVATQALPKTLAIDALQEHLQVLMRVQRKWSPDRVARSSVKSCKRQPNLLIAKTDILLPQGIVLLEALGDAADER